MKWKIGMFKAKTHLPELISHVQKRQETCLTNRNEKGAVIVPVENYYKEKKPALFKELKNLLKKSPLGTVDDLINMKNEGRE